MIRSSSVGEDGGAISNGGRAVGLRLLASAPPLALFHPPARSHAPLHLHPATPTPPSSPLLFRTVGSHGRATRRLIDRLAPSDEEPRRGGRRRHQTRQPTTIRTWHIDKRVEHKDS